MSSHTITNEKEYNINMNSNYEKKYFQNDWYEWNTNFELAHGILYNKNINLLKTKQNIREIWHKINQENIKEKDVEYILDKISDKTNKDNFENFFGDARNYTSHYFHSPNDYRSSFNKIKDLINDIYTKINYKKFKNSNNPKYILNHGIFLIILIFIGTKGHKFIYVPKDFTKSHNKLNCKNVLDDSILSIYSNLNYLLNKLSESKLIYRNKEDKEIYDPRNVHFFISKIIVPYFKYLIVQHDIKDYKIFNNSEMNDEWDKIKSISKKYKNRFNPNFFYLKNELKKEYIQISIKKLFFCFDSLGIKKQLLSLDKNDFEDILNKLFEEDWKANILVPNTEENKQETSKRNKNRSDWNDVEIKKVKKMLKNSFDIRVTNKNQVSSQLFKTINLFYKKEAPSIFLKNYYSENEIESIKLFREYIFAIIKNKDYKNEKFKDTKFQEINKYVKKIKSCSEIKDLSEKVKKDTGFEGDDNYFNIENNNLSFMKLLTYNKYIIKIITPSSSSEELAKTKFMQKQDFINLISNLGFDKSTEDSNEFISNFFKSFDTAIENLELKDDFDVEQIEKINSLDEFIDWYFNNKSLKKENNNKNTKSLQKKGVFKPFCGNARGNLSGEIKMTNNFYVQALISNNNEKAFKIKISNNKNEITNFKEFINLREIVVKSFDKTKQFKLTNNERKIEKVDIESDYLKLIIEIIFEKNKSTYSYEELKKEINCIEQDIKSVIKIMLDFEKGVYRRINACCKEIKDKILKINKTNKYVNFRQFEKCYLNDLKSTNANLKKLSFDDFKDIRNILLHQGWNEILKDNNKINNLKQLILISRKNHP